MGATQTNGPRDAGNWAKPTAKLHVDEVPAGARNLVEGKRVVGPIQGFGKMWQKTYRARLEGLELSPAEVIQEWKESFASFWPEGNRFYPPLTGIKPGEVALIKAAVAGGLKLSTGVLVMYADDESFTLMTPQGHPLAGWITFSAVTDSGTTTAQAQVLMRAQDPLSELGLSLGGHRQEDRFWQQTLGNLAAHLGVAATVSTQVTCVDGKRQWSRAGNIRHSAALRIPLAARPPRRSAR
jgi:hypothetical protein